MKKYSIINYKGGTGKTSVAVQLAHGLALENQRVLLIDMDPQGSAGYHLGVQGEYGVYELLMGERPYFECITPARKNLHMICANERLFPAELELAKKDRREFILSDRLEGIQGYDYVLIDCAPAMNVLNQNALLFTKQVILPVSMEYLALNGVKQLLNNIQIINRIFQVEIAVSKVVPTFYDLRNNKSKDVLNSISRVFPGRISVPIPTSIALSEAPGYQQTIFEFDPRSKGAKAYKKLVEEVCKNG